VNANDRKRLVAVARALREITHPAWQTVEDTRRAKGRRNLEALVTAAPLDLRR
jgi:hypothetical protein